MLEISLYIIVLVSFYAQFFKDYILIIRGSGLWIQDIVLVFIYLIFLYKFLLIKRKIISPLLIIWSLLIFVILLPIIVGIIKGNFLLTIFRDSRAPFYYLLPFIFFYAIKTEDKWLRICKFIVANSILCLMIFYFMKFLNLEFQAEGMMSPAPLLTGDYSRGFGIYSSWNSFILVFFFFFSMAHLCKISYKNKILLALVLFASFWAIASLLIRSLMYSFLFGFAMNVFLIFKEKKSYLMRFSHAGIIFILAVVLLWSIVGEEIYSNPFFERYLSLFNPEISSSSANYSLEFRKQAIKLSIEKCKEDGMTLLFGKGYGDEPLLVSEERNQMLVALLNHSSVAWIIYRLGLLLGALALILLIIIFIKIWKFSKFIKNPKIKSYYYGIFSYLISIFLASFAGNQFFRGDYNTLFFLIGMGLLFSIIQIEVGKTS